MEVSVKTTLGGRAAILLALALITGFSGAASAQTNLTSSAEIQRLQDNVYEASRDVTQLRSRDSVLASQLQVLVPIDPLVLPELDLQVHGLVPGIVELALKLGCQDAVART